MPVIGTFTRPQPRSVMSNAERQRKFRARHPNYHRRYYVTAATWKERLLALSRARDAAAAESQSREDAKVGRKEGEGLDPTTPTLPPPFASGL